MSCARLRQLRVFAETAFVCFGASWGEGTGRAGSLRCGGRGGFVRVLRLCYGGDSGGGGEQKFSVGVKRVAVQVRGGGFFHQFAFVHYADSVAEVARHF